MGWRDVEDHADDAEARGWVVRREEFGGSMHVAHARVDEGRYWGIVKAVFDAAQSYQQKDSASKG